MKERNPRGLSKYLDKAQEEHNKDPYSGVYFWRVELGKADAGYSFRTHDNVRDSRSPINPDLGNLIAEIIVHTSKWSRPIYVSNGIPNSSFRPLDNYEFLVSTAIEEVHNKVFEMNLKKAEKLKLIEEKARQKEKRKKNKPFSQKTLDSMREYNML